MQTSVYTKYIRGARSRARIPRARRAREEIGTGKAISPIIGPDTYDPGFGRFISEDPRKFGGDGSNFYSYVLNDPIDWFDPTGEGRQGQRGQAARPDGTNNPFKKLTPDPDDPMKVKYKDPDGKTKAKPEGFDDYWKKKHPPKNKCEASESNPHWWLLTHPVITYDLFQAMLDDVLPSPPPPPTNINIPAYGGPLPWWVFATQ